MNFVLAADSMSSSSSKAHVPPSADGHALFVPARLEEFLKDAKDFGEFKARRALRFLHLFAGPRDVLAEAWKRSARKRA